MEQIVILSYVKGVITGIHHIAISVPDIETASKFYHEVLGFEKVCLLYVTRPAGGRPGARTKTAKHSEYSMRCCRGGGGGGAWGGSGILGYIGAGS